MDNNKAQDVIYTGQLGCNDGYYLCPNCHYQLIYKEDLTSTVDFYYKQFCEFCGTKLNWTNRDTIGSQINKVDFLADTFKMKKEYINILTVDKVDSIIEDYVYCRDENEALKLEDKLNSYIEEAERNLHKE